MNLLINGLITGAVFAVAATGLVVTYSTSGVFNFAHGALGMFCAYLYWDLRVNQHHHWPLLPKGAWPAPLALATVLLVLAPLLGAGLYLVVIRGLHGTSETVKLVVPISVLLALIGLANWIWKPNVAHSIPPFFGADHKVVVFGVVLLWHDLTVLVVAALLAVVLRLFMFRTRTGVTMRAVVDDGTLVRLNGGRPQHMALISWMIGVSLSALAGILITPSQGGTLSSTLLTLLVINAFAAAMFGRLRNVPLTFVGAVVLGLATRMAFERPTGLVPKTFDWRGNLRLAVPMILLFAVLVALPQDRLRGATAARTRERFTVPTMPAALTAGCSLVVVVFLLSRLMAPAALLTFGNAMAVAVIMLSLVVLVGYAGEVSLATMALAGIGGTVFFHHVGHAAADRAGWGAYVPAILVTSAVGAVVALPALRLRGLYLALATAAFSIGVEQMVFKEFAAQRRIYPATLIGIAIGGVAIVGVMGRARRWRAAQVASVATAAVFVIAATNGRLQRARWSAIFPDGNLQVPRPRLFGIDFAPQANFLLLLTVVFAILGVALVAIRRSDYGQRITALKDSPAACATLGMNIVRLKLSVFVLSAALAGLGGCLFAQQIGAVTSGRFGLFDSMTMLMLLVVAGAGYVSGGLAAGLLSGAVFVTLQGIFTRLGHDFSAFAGPLKWLAQFTTVLPALIGIGLGRNPSGFLDDSFGLWGPVVRRLRPLFLVAVGAELAVWFLALTKVVGNWTFAIFSGVVVTALPRLAQRARPELFPPSRTVAVDAAVAARLDDSVPLELIGIDRPFVAADLVAIDRVLGMPADARPSPIAESVRTKSRSRGAYR